MIRPPGVVAGKIGKRSDRTAVWGFGPGGREDQGLPPQPEENLRRAVRTLSATISEPTTARTSWPLRAGMVMMWIVMKVNAGCSWRRAFSHSVVGQMQRGRGINLPPRCGAQPRHSSGLDPSAGRVRMTLRRVSVPNTCPRPAASRRARATAACGDNIRVLSMLTSWSSASVPKIRGYDKRASIADRAMLTRPQGFRSWGSLTAVRTSGARSVRYPYRHQLEPLSSLRTSRAVAKTPSPAAPPDGHACVSIMPLPTRTGFLV